jgi:putative transposase
MGLKCRGGFETRPCVKNGGLRGVANAVIDRSSVNDDVSKRRRRWIRLSGYDYAQAGAYFVTIVGRHRACLFGEVVNDEMRPNQFGRIVQSTWDELPDHYAGVECDAFMAMPNHAHGIIVLADERGVGESDVGAGLKPARGIGPDSVRAGLKPAPTLSEIIRGFKTFSARRVNELRETPGVPVWQRNYYEHVVRGENELHRIREYIANNPLKWEIDWENPLRTSDGLKRKAEPWEV